MHSRFFRIRSAFVRGLCTSFKSTLMHSSAGTSAEQTAQTFDAATTQAIHRAAEAIRESQALLITSGAGMGVDSGLPDFRGPEGFWRAYPPLRKLGLTLPETSTPSWFERDPNFAWGFFGHRYKLYSTTQPHKGFGILLKWCLSKPDYFVFTSNVDGHFQKAGFDEQRVLECHGSIHHLQCIEPALSSTIWPAANQLDALEVDTETLRAKEPLPLGPPGRNEQLARPNILMFSDWNWVSERTDLQQERFNAFEQRIKSASIPFTVIEIGAGLAVPTVRLNSERLASRTGGTLIRINPTDHNFPRALTKKCVSVPLKGLQGLEAIDTALKV